MKNRMITVTGLCVVLMSSTLSKAEDKNLSTAKETTKKSSELVVDKLTNRSFSASNLAGDSSVMPDLAIGFVDSFAIMGECEEGQKARKEIEGKRDLASQEIQEESKKLEKAKNDYLSKSSMMSDSAREKEEKQLMKKDRELKAFVAEKEEDLKAEMQAATETLAQSLDAGVVELAKKEGLDVIFDKMTGRAMYVSPKFDFTDKAVTAVNKNYEVKLAQNKQAEQALKVADNKAAAPKSAKVGA
jgi:Skp family chaperone for outer membrane proteins